MLQNKEDKGLYCKLPHDVSYSEKNLKTTNDSMIKTISYSRLVMLSKHFVSTSLTNIDIARVSV